MTILYQQGFSTVALKIMNACNNFIGILEKSVNYFLSYLNKIITHYSKPEISIRLDDN